MPEPFYRFGEWVVPPVVAMNGTKFTFRGLENIPERGGALLAQNHGTDGVTRPGQSQSGTH